MGNFCDCNKANYPIENENKPITERNNEQDFDSASENNLNNLNNNLSSQAKEIKKQKYSSAQPHQKPEGKLKLYTYKLEAFKYNSNAREELIREISKQAELIKKDNLVTSFQDIAHDQEVLKQDISSLKIIYGKLLAFNKFINDINQGNTQDSSTTVSFTNIKTIEEFEVIMNSIITSNNDIFIKKLNETENYDNICTISNKTKAYSLESQILNNLRQEYSEVQKWKNKKDDGLNGISREIYFIDQIKLKRNLILAEEEEAKKAEQLRKTTLAVKNKKLKNNVYESEEDDVEQKNFGDIF